MVLIDQLHLSLSYLNVDCSYEQAVEPDKCFFFFTFDPFSMLPMGAFVMDEVSCSNVSGFVAFVRLKHNGCSNKNVLGQNYADFLSYL